MAAQLRILIAEDSQDDAELILLRLENEGINADWRRVETEQDFLAALDWRPDLIVCNYSMPGFSGLRALELRNARSSDIPLILVSGTIGEEVAVQALKRGADDYLLKDRLERLGPAVEHALKQRRLLREKQQAEQLLRESEEQYRSLFTNMLDGFAYCKMQFENNEPQDFVYIAVNPAFELLTGLKDVLGKKVTDVIPGIKETNPELFEIYGRVALSGKPESFETYVQPLGIWFHLSVYSLEAGYFVAVFNNITDRKLAEEALRNSEQRYRSLAESAQDAIFLIGKDGRIQYVNTHGAKWFGRRPEDMIGLRRAEAFPPEVAILQQQSLDHVIESGEAHFSQNQPFSPGGSRWINTVLTPIKDAQGKVQSVLGIARDLSAQMQAEETLKRRLTELEALYRVSTALRTANSLDEMMPMLLDESLAVIGSEAGTIKLFDPASQSLVSVVSRGWYTEIEDIVVKPDEGIAGRVFTSGEPYMRREFVSAAEALDSARARIPAGWGGACVPIRAAQSVTGVLFIAVPLPRELDQSDVRLLTTLAEIAGSSIHRMRLFEQTRRYAQQMESINALGRALAESLDLTVIYERLARAALDLLPDSAGVFISLYDAEHKLITAAYGLQDGLPVDTSSLPALPLAPPNKGTQSKVIHTGQPLIVDDLQATFKRNKSKVTIVGTESALTESAVYVPMIAEGKMIGLLQLQSYTKARYTQADAELLRLVANTAAVAIQNAGLFTKLEQRVDQLSGLHAIDTAIGSTTDLHMSLRTVLDNVIRLMEVDAAAILLINQATLTLEHVVSRGFRMSEITKTSIRFGEGAASRAALDRQLIHLPDPAALAQDSVRKSLIESEGFEAYAVTPLIAKGQVRGVLEVYKRSAQQADREWQDFLKVLASQASLAVDSGQMFEGLGRANLELTLAYDATIEGWSQALDLRDTETEGHTQRVTDLTIRLARVMELSSASLIHIRRGALLHDIGKMGIPDRILLKPGKLTDKEWEIMRRHPEYAHDLLSRISYLRPALDIPYCHHEKWDGSGYPRGLKGEHIPLPARIFAVVDVYDALTSDRPYRPAWSKKKALAYIREQPGKHFDPKVSEAFLKMIKEKTQ